MIDNSIQKKLLLKLTIISSIVTLFISVSFSALSTTLSISGSAKFVPVGMIRVMSIAQDTLTDVTEIEKQYTLDSIRVLIDFDEETGTATYNVNITNLGQTDKQLTQIIDEIYSNIDVTYELNGLDLYDVIRAGESRDFKITFKYRDGVTNPDSRLNAKIQFVFDDYVEPSGLITAFNHDGACTFNGTSNITGTECSEYWDTNYIDTGIKLYNQDNYKKDFEVGFTIENYDGTIQDDQAVFFNAKNETGVTNVIVPGFVIRKEKKTTKNIEITSAIDGIRATKTAAYSQGIKIKLFRRSNVLYYSVNDGELIELQDITGFDEQFDITSWFGASPNASGGVIRNLKGTLSHMYIKLGNYQKQKYTITFDPNGGSVSEVSREVLEGDPIGQLPTPTNADSSFVFAGWYKDINFTIPVSETTLVTRDDTYYARWENSLHVAIDGVEYNTLENAIDHIKSTDGQKTIKIYENISACATIDEGKDIIIDLGNNTLSNSKSLPIITNKGKLKIINGTYSSNAGEAVINNNSTGTLEITGGTIRATGTKQALYNNGGTLTISGNTNLSATSSIRATVHNLNSGKLKITSGTITSANYSGVFNESGTLTIGNEDGNVDITTPSIEGKIYGVNSSLNYSLYDGIIKGETNAVSDQTKINQTETGYGITTGSDGNYETLYLTAQ